MRSIAILVLASACTSCHGHEQHLSSQEAECTNFPQKELLGSQRVLMQQNYNHANRHALVNDQTTNGTKVHLHTKTNAISTVIMMSEVAFLGTDGKLAAKVDAPQFLVPDVPCSGFGKGASARDAPPGCVPIATVIRLATDTSKCLTMPSCATSGSPVIANCLAPSACDQWNVYPSWAADENAPQTLARRGRITWAKDSTKCLGLQGQGGGALSSVGSPVLLEACDDENPSAWEQQWAAFPDLRVPSGMGSVVPAISQFTTVGMGACLTADGTYTDIGWAPCTCASGPCAVASGDCPTVEGCADDCISNSDCAAFAYYDRHCWLFGGKTAGSKYTKTSDAFKWYECFAMS